MRSSGYRLCVFQDVFHLVIRHQPRTAISSDDPDQPIPPPGEWPTPPRKQRERTRDILNEFKRPTQRFPWRVAIYSVVLAYLAFDLYVLDGPLRRRVDASRAGSADTRERAIEENWVAVINGRPITMAQLERGIEIYNFKRGIDSGSFSEKNRMINRLAVLDDMIDDELLRSHAENSPVIVDPAEIDAALERFTQQFRDDKVLQFNLRVQQIPRAELRELIAAQLGQIAWLEHNIAAGITVSEEEARAWFDENRDQFGIPEVVRARHLFLSTVEDDAREALIRELHRQLVEENADFAALVAEHSDDPRTKETGGDLNYFSRHRLAPDFTERVFALETHQLSEPFRTSIGWHIAEVTDRKPARAGTFEEIKPEILRLLETRKREIAVAEIIRRLRLNSAARLFPAAFEAPQSKEQRAEGPEP